MGKLGDYVEAREVYQINYWGVANLMHLLSPVRVGPHVLMPMAPTHVSSGDILRPSSAEADFGQ